MESCFVWDLDPVIMHLGPLQLRYYGLIFATMLYIGFIIWRKQMLRAGYSIELAERFLIWGVLAVLIGARLGHCLFYEPERYLSDPITILYFWQGGLASHGATIGLVVAMFLYCKKYNLRYLEVLDRMAMPSAVGAAAVRLGNFFNSEIVGRSTDVPWAINFVRYDAMMGEPATCRHPSQLYEFFMGLFVLLALFLADRFAGKEKRPLGLLASLFLILYFAGRFTVEYFKEFQTLEQSTLTMGQYLSILPFTAGLILLGWVVAKRIPTSDGQAERLGKAHNPPPAQKGGTSGKSASSSSKTGNKGKGSSKSGAKNKKRKK